MKLPEPQAKTFSTLVSEIEKGQIKIPQFQRDFVWTMQKSAGLIDSIVKGYPIGTFILWRTKERLRSVRNIGNQVLPDPEEGEFIDYVLDGQQRLTSLFASLRGVTLKREDGREDDFSKIFIDLDAEESEQIVITDIEGKNEKSLISILILRKGDFILLASYPQKYHEKIGIYKNRIESYQYSTILVKDAPIDIATEIFTRINVGGKPLSLFEIMVAKTFDHEKNFDLTEKFQELIDNLKPLDYETISDATVLQVVSIIISKECKRQVILQLDKNEFINVWPKAIDSIERTVEYFRNYYRIPVSQLLPYNALIIPFSYFFFHHKDKAIGDKQKYLEDFFWRCSLSGRYSSAVESKLAQDVKRIDKILYGELPSYDWSIDTSEEFIKNNGSFSAARSYIKAILCIYSYHQPKSFNDNSIVNISNYWLKQANSKNYHHFFPRAYLKTKDYGVFYINHILNITIVDDFLNKREIGAKAPSKYMAKFQEVNPDLNNTMKTHLIEDLNTFGIWDDDFEKFIDERAKVVSRELSKRVIKQEVDRKGQAKLVDDFEEELTTVE
ncbi:GmrSD restriction endonuclease domain-containing protein [Nostoc sp.]|uniref:GmrSD restriction endonuclease domain-containing protein n=1 Tax=Nostoc sp. TaxID=1180 RepID=UPI002FFA4568